MKQRRDESDEDYRARRAAYELVRKPRNWREQQRTLDATGNVKSITEVRRGRKPSAAPPIGNPVASSTLYDREGRVTAQWIKTRPDEQDPELFARTLLAELKVEVPRLPLILQRDMPSYTEKLMACYPVGDHHMGMLSWRPETGASYDLEISERLLVRAFQHLIPQAPRCQRAVVAFLGDFFHYDGEVPETPHGKQKLDADSRYQKMIRAGRRAIQTVIGLAAAWHNEVLVIFEPGNHDPHTMTIMAEMFAAVYENNPRITIDTAPRVCHYFQFGQNLVGTHHGDLIKPEKLPLIMAHDQPQMWADTTYRTWWTGHLHHDMRRDIEGVRVERFRVLPPGDAWAHNRGYRSIRDMQALVLHADGGEVARYTVNPKMLES